jgi:hypothetical protein
MTERPDAEWEAGRPVDRLESPSRRPPRRRAVVIGVLVALIGAGSLTKAVVSDQPDHPRAPAAASGRPTPTGRPTDAQEAAADTADVTDGVEVVADARISGRVRAGDTLRFVVVLRSNRLVLLHPCPAYTITFGTHTTRRQLSCDGVPYVVSVVHPDGTVSAFRPALPAGTAVAFRMHVRVPEGSGRRHVTWALLGARPAIVSGTVTVTGRRS